MLSLTFFGSNNVRLSKYSRGIPRLINNIAILCLLNACIKNLKKITDEILIESIEELGFLVR